MSLDSILFSRATDLARRGHFQGAEALLDELAPEARARGHVLDLRARMQAQQGRLREAETLWTEALRADPGNPSYEAARRRAAQGRSSSLAPKLAFGLVILLVIAIAWWKIESTASRLDASIQRLEQRNNMVEPVHTTVREAIQPLDIHIDVPGISARQDRSDLVLVFASGLFDRATDLRPESRKLIHDLAGQIESHREPLALTIVGHSDDKQVLSGRPYADNVSLGLHRALVVSDLLRSSLRASPEMFFITSRGSELTPYPNDTAENQARNRTVSIRLSRRPAADSQGAER